MSQNTATQRMDELLNHWEKSYFMLEVFNNHKNKLLFEKPCPDINVFRKFLLTTATKSHANKSASDFIPGSDKSLTELYEEAYSVCTSIMSWNHYSRRIFHLQPNMQMLLDATSLKNIKWKSIKFPFNAFLVGLSEPLVADNGAVYDSFLFTRIDEFMPDTSSEVWEIRLLPQVLAGRKRMRQTDPKRIWRNLNGTKDEFEFGKKYLTKKYLDPKKDVTMPVQHIVLDDLLEQNVMDFLKEFKEPRHGLKNYPVDSAFHILINLCLYLENFPSSITKQHKQFTVKKHRKKGGKKNTSKKTFVDELTDLFTVSCKFNMNKSTMDELAKFVKSSKASHEKRAHWRRAHWRRKPNCGNIPFEYAPKDWFPMKLINAHRLPENTLPLVTETII